MPRMNLDTPGDMLIALSHLTPDEREALVDHRYLGLSHEAIGKRDGVSHMTVWKREQAGLRKLEQILAR